MADGSDEEENWPEFFENNRLIPVHPNRRKSGSQSKPNVPFRLLFKSVVGVSLPQSLVSTAGYFCYFQLLLLFTCLWAKILPYQSVAKYSVNEELHEFIIYERKPEALMHYEN